MKFDSIILKKQEQIATIVLNKPEHLNPMDHSMMREMLAAIADVAGDSKIRVLVITGAGRSFSSGADKSLSDVRSGKLKPAEADEIKETVKGNMEQGTLIYDFPEVTLALSRLGKPVIAMVNGHAVGSGLDLALACDFRIGSDKAKLSVGYTGVGVVPASGSSWLLPRIVGLGKALELILTSKYIGAAEAERIGLLNKVTPAEELEKATLEFAEQLVKVAPVGQKLAKLNVYAGLTNDLEKSLQFATACNHILLNSEDYAESITAIAQGRAPVYKGR